MEKYYKILEIKTDATLPEVKKAYRHLVKVWHPDRFTDDIELQKKADEKLKGINEAYQKIVDYLSKADQRSHYRPEKQEGSADEQPATWRPTKQTKPGFSIHLKENWGWYALLALFALGAMFKECG